MLVYTAKIVYFLVLPLFVWKREKRVSLCHGKLYGKTDIGEDTFAVEYRLRRIGSNNQTKSKRKYSQSCITG
jgi:hypothetical protein